MTKNTVSIEFEKESLTRFANLLGNHSLATGVHCGDDDGDLDGVHGRCRGAVASGAHCGDDIDG